MDLCHLRRIPFRRLWVKLDNVGPVRQRQLGLHNLLTRFQLIEAIADLLRAPPVFDLTDEPPRLPIDFRKLSLQCRPRLGSLAREALTLHPVRFDCGGNHVGLEEVASQGR
ncbi:MAG: hypothetical protein AB7K67_02550 [Hyphomicrobiaceae bacterium]